jgi:GrpB-like predicted nucleotidyltransferase (UPF0157 family)
MGIAPLPLDARLERYQRQATDLIKAHRSGDPEATHYFHMVEAAFVEHWDRLLFRDYLAAHPHVAHEYQRLKVHLASAFPRDRVAYTKGKTEFIVRVTEDAKRFYGKT